MTLRTRPRAPWHSPTTRRLAILRIGVPTLLACVFAAGPALATEAPKLPPQAMHIVGNVTRAAREAVDPGHDGHRADATDLRSRGER
jgi:hypothetical protein